MPAAQRTYARSLFEAARESGRLEPVRDELRAFLEATEQVPELRAVLENPELDSKVKADVLRHVLADSDELVRNFLLLVTAKGRSGEIDEIAREYEELVAAEEGILNVEITTAIELSDEDFTSIVRQIEQASGRTVQASRSVDPSLIGGIVLQVGSLRLDASVRGRLERLRQELATVRRSGSDLSAKRTSGGGLGGQGGSPSS